MTQSLYVRKKVVQTAFLFIIILTIFFGIGMIRARADAPTMSNVKQAYQLAKNMEQSSKLVSNIVEATSIITGKEDANGNSSPSITETIGLPAGMNEVVSAVAAGLIGIYILLNIIKESAKGEATMEYWFRVFFVLGVSLYVIAHWNYIIGKVDSAGQALLSSIEKSNDNNGTDKRALLASCLNMLYEEGQLTEEITSGSDILNNFLDGDEWKDEVKWEDVATSLTTSAEGGDGTFSTSLIMTIRITLFQLLRIGFVCAIHAQIYMIAMQLVIRKAIAPIAVADISIEGARSGGVRYLKRYFALYLQIGIIIVIAFVFNQFVTTSLDTSTTGSGLGSLYTLLTSMGALIAAVSQSGALSAEVIGD